jgi:hypothetical protein
MVTTEVQATATSDTRDGSARPTRRRRVVRYVSGGLAATVVLAWLGLRVDPHPAPPPPLAAGEVTRVPLPDGLPAPVARFYTELYGDEVPLIQSAVISGRGTMRVAGVTFPARWRFSHSSGEAYRHHIELTVFGRRLLAVDEWFLDGHARLELPFGTSEGPGVDQGANLALWAEAVWMPSIWITDPRVSWEPIDATSASLVVPFGDTTEHFTVEFDPTTGLLQRMESMRSRGDEAEARTLWINEAPTWGELDGWLLPLRTTVTWGDERSAWADLRTEEVVYNAELDAYIGRAGW